MNCLKCGGAVTMHVQCLLKAPGDMYHMFSKRNLRSKSVYLEGVLWETADFICENSQCGHVTLGYGNYVRNLEKRVAALNAREKG